MEGDQYYTKWKYSWIDNTFVSSDDSGSLKPDCIYYSTSSVLSATNSFAIDSEQNIISPSEYMKDGEVFGYADAVTADSVSIYSTDAVANNHRRITSETPIDSSNFSVGRYLWGTFSSDNPVKVIYDRGKMTLDKYRYLKSPLQAIILSNSVSDAINALDLGFDNTGTKDNSDLLNLILNDPVVYKYDHVLYFPPGVYCFTKTVYGSRATIIGDKENYQANSTVFVFKPQTENTVMFSTYMGNNEVAGIKFKNITFFNYTSDDEFNYQVTRLNSDLPSPENGVKNYHVESSTMNGISCLIVRNSPENCTFRGFSGAAIIYPRSFIKTDAIVIYDCKYGIITCGTEYHGDHIITNCQISNGNTAIITGNWLNVTDCWIDEMSRYAISTDYTDVISMLQSYGINHDVLKYGLAINLHSSHFNHIDSNVIHSSDSISGNIYCIMNRYGCNYAGFTTTQLNQQQIMDSAMIYATGIVRLNFYVSTSNAVIGDQDAEGQDRQKVGVLGIYCDGVCRGLSGNLSGTTNSNIPLIVKEKDGSDSDLTYIDGQDNNQIKLWDIQSEKGINLSDNWILIE